MERPAETGASSSRYAERITKITDRCQGILAERRQQLRRKREFPPVRSSSLLELPYVDDLDLERGSMSRCSS